LEVGMARLGLLRWSQLACAGALTALIATGCGGDSSSDDPGGGSGGSSGSAGGSKAGKGGSGGSGGKGAGGTTSKGGSGGSSAGTQGNEGGEPGSGGEGGTGAAGTAGTAGTGGSGGAPPDIPINQMCETFEPCGGDPEGSWTIVDTCLETPGEIPLLDVEGCEDAVQGVGVDVVGTRTYENGEVTFDQVATVRVAAIVSDACAAAVSMAMQEVDANELCPFLPALAALNMDTPFERIDCAVVDEQCNCDLYLNAETTTTTTTYVVDGSHITQGDGAEYDFCQEGDSLIVNGLQESEMTSAVNELTVEFERQ
jgi:hypothetical protein